MLEGNIGFIGGGKMAEAIFGGLLSSGCIAPEQLYVSDLNGARLDMLREKYRMNTVLAAGEEGNAALLDRVDVVVLAVVPQAAAKLLEGIAPRLEKRHLVVSIMGGVTLAYLESWLRENPVVRVMPNVTMQACAGIAGIALGSRAAEESRRVVCDLFDAIGRTFVLPEELIDPLTGISGCGPAFAAMFVEALADGGVAAGLPRGTAIELAAQLLVGSGKMILDQQVHPEVMKDSVCTPGGSTIAGCRALERGAFRFTVISAVEEAIGKMREVARDA